jgi:hypothetical protein
MARRVTEEQLDEYGAKLTIRLNRILYLLELEGNAEIAEGERLEKLNRTTRALYRMDGTEGYSAREGRR